MTDTTEAPAAPTETTETEGRRYRYQGSATYSPEDDKLRLYPFCRLSKEDYERAKGLGFKWAPKQECFFAVWSPGREDLLAEWCGEIEDEDKTLAERAEERAERFEGYRDNRLGDAQSARAAVSAIADNIPFGQPILVGHHSERRARKDAEKIQNGMARCVKAFETADYWRSRAARAIAAAKYKERPDVRARRIKGLEAEARRMEASRKQSELSAKFWRGELKLKNAAGPVEYAITEEHRAMLCEICGGGLGSAFDRYIIGTEWSAWDLLRPKSDRYRDCPDMTVAEIQAKALQNSAASIRHYDRWLAHLSQRLEYERAMLAADGGTVADKTGPEVGGACRCWASPTGGWSIIQKVNKVSVTLLDNWGNGGRDFTRTIPFDKLKAIMTRAQVEEARAGGRLLGETKRGFTLCDDPTKAPQPKPVAQPDPQAAEVEAMKQTLKAGVQVVAAPQLFPTPPELAERVIDEAVIGAGDRVLEPSAGTGALVHAVLADGFRGQVVAIECNGQLVDGLRKRLAVQRAEDRVCVLGGDFLAITPQPEPQGVGQFDRIVMNPPFERGADLRHIQHAATFLRPGGRLVSICAQREETREWIEAEGGTYEPLPDGSFAEQGTNVRTAIVTLDR